MSTANVPTRGLEGVVAGNSSICFIDGDQGILSYRGIDIHELADNSTFEEICYLLWYGALPKKKELALLREHLAAERKLNDGVLNLLRQAPRKAPPMSVLRTAISALALYDADAEAMDHEANLRKAIRLVSQTAMLIASYDRIRKGRPVVEPDKALTTAGNFLLMLNGEPPSAAAERALDVALILHADHELNASTFAARVTAATLADMHSAVTSAMGALKGPLHGGANEQVMKLLFKIAAEGKDPVAAVRQLFAEKKKLPGFGHRVYRTEDPRATHLRAMSRELGKASGKGKWFEMSRKIEEFVNAEKKLNANVDFYSASTYTALGIDLDLFTPIFALSRMSGWTAHIIEQIDDNRLIRPRAEYVGPAYPQPYVPMERR